MDEMGRSLWFDRKAKKVILRARVVLREGYLEHFMCSKGTKEHEAILATDAVPHLIHAGLLLTGAEAGHPVRFVPKFRTTNRNCNRDRRRMATRRQGPQGRCSAVGQGREGESSPGDRLGVCRQRVLRRPGHQQAGLRRRRGRSDHGGELRKCDSRPANCQFGERCRPRVRYKHRENPAAWYRGICHTRSPESQGKRQALILRA